MCRPQQAVSFAYYFAKRKQGTYRSPQQNERTTMHKKTTRYDDLLAGSKAWQIFRRKQ